MLNVGILLMKIKQSKIIPVHAMKAYGSGWEWWYISTYS